MNNKTKEFEKQRSNKFTFILNDNELNLFKSAKYIVNKLKQALYTINFIACIKHDKDLDEEINQIKTVHYHLIIVFNGNHAFGTLLRTFENVFHVNRNQVQIDKCTSVQMQVRYLTHIDDYDKFQYNKEDIVTNDYTVLNRYYKLKILKDIPECVQYVKEMHYDLESIMLNISNYNEYRKYINDLIINHNRKRGF